MKSQRSILLLISMTMFLLASVNVIAQDSNDLRGMASYFPEATDFWVAMDISDDSLQTLGDVLDPVIAKISAQFDAPEVTVQQMVDEALAEMDISYDDVRQWLGDSVAIGGNIFMPRSVDSDLPPDGLIVLDIVDRDAFVSFVDEQAELNDVEFQVEEADGELIYSVEDDPTQMIITDDVVFIYPDESLRSTTAETTLNDNEDFQNSLSQLPADEYGIYVYVAGSLFEEAMADTGMDEVEQLDMLGGVFPDSLVVGLTILEGRSFTIDVVQVGAGAELSADPVTIDFAQYIPASADFYVQGRNLTSIVDSLLDFAATATEEDRDDLELQVSSVLGLIQVDLREDILSWTTGDFAIFASIDSFAIFELIEGTRLVPEDIPFDFGLVIEATNPETAQELAAKLGEAIVEASAEDDTVEVSIEQVRGVDVVKIIADVDGVPLELVLGASDDVFFLTTTDSAEVILSGDGTLLNTPNYQEASATFLPDTLSIGYVSDDGIASLVSVVAWFGSMFGAMPSFDALDATTTTLIQDDFNFAEIYTFLTDTFHSATFTTQLVDTDTYVVRLVLSLTEDAVTFPTN